MAQDIEYLRQQGMAVSAGLGMETVMLSPQRINPDLYNAVIQYVPELLAEGLWGLMGKSRLGLAIRDEVAVIQGGKILEQRLNGQG